MGGVLAVLAFDGGFDGGEAFVEGGGAFEVEDAAGLAGVGEGDAGVGDGEVLGGEGVEAGGEGGDGDGGVRGGVAGAGAEGGDEGGEVGGEFHVGLVSFAARFVRRGWGGHLGGGGDAAEFIGGHFNGFELVGPSLVGFDETERLGGGVADGFDEIDAGLGSVGVGHFEVLHVGIGGIDAVDEELEIGGIERGIHGAEERSEEEQRVFEELGAGLAVAEGEFGGGGHDGWWVGCGGAGAKGAF